MGGVIVGARPLAKPLRIGPGVIRPGLHAAGQGLGEHVRGRGLQLAADQADRAGRLECQGPPVLAAGADLGQFHLAPGLVAPLLGTHHDLPVGKGEPADAPPLAHRPPAGRPTAIPADRAQRKGPLLPGLQAPAGAAGHLEDSRAAAIHLHLNWPAAADLHRHPGPRRIPAGRHPRVILFWPGTGRTIRPPQPSARPGKIQRTSRLRTRRPAAAWPDGTQLCPAATADRLVRVSWTGVSAVTEPPPSGVPAQCGTAGLAGQPEVALVCGKPPGYRAPAAELLQAGRHLGSLVQIRAAAALTADQPGRAGMPACSLAAGGGSSPAGRAVPPRGPGRGDQAGKARGAPRRPAAATGHGDQTVPAVRGTQADGFWSATGFWGANGFCVHQAPRRRQIPGTAGVWSSTTTTSLTDATHCGVSNRRYPLRPGLLPLLRDKPGERLHVKQ